MCLTMVTLNNDTRTRGNVVLVLVKMMVANTINNHNEGNMFDCLIVAYMRGHDEGEYAFARRATNHNKTQQYNAAILEGMKGHETADFIC